MALRLADLAAGSLALVGVPLDCNSSFLRGPALAPARIREALFSGSTNSCAEDGTEVLPGRLVDAGDLDLPADASAMAAIETGIAGVLERGARVQSLGGARIMEVVVGADVVELNPLRDPVGATAAVGAKLVKDLAARMLRVAAGPACP